jgi:hypothetical protein
LSDRRTARRRSTRSRRFGGPARALASDAMAWNAKCQMLGFRTTSFQGSTPGMTVSRITTRATSSYWRRYEYATMPPTSWPTRVTSVSPRLSTRVWTRAASSRLDPPSSGPVESPMQGRSRAMARASEAVRVITAAHDLQDCGQPWRNTNAGPSLGPASTMCREESPIKDCRCRRAVSNGGES